MQQHLILLLKQQTAGVITAISVPIGTGKTQGFAGRYTPTATGNFVKDTKTNPINFNTGLSKSLR